jgi:DtxR family Mn-dependent transcriptional regulator
LIDRLDEFMGHPTRDPHGDPIPDSNGNFKTNDLKPISAIAVHSGGIIAGVRDHSSAFLQYLEKQKLTIGKKIIVKEIITYDNTVVLHMDNKDLHISRDVANNLLITL